MLTNSYMAQPIIFSATTTGPEIEKTAPSCSSSFCFLSEGAMTGGGAGDSDGSGEEGCSSTIISAGRLSAVNREICVGEDGEPLSLRRVEEVEVEVGVGVAGSGGRWSKGGEAVVASSAAESASSMNVLLCDSKSSRDGRTLSRGLNPRPSIRFADIALVLVRVS